MADVGNGGVLVTVHPQSQNVVLYECYISITKIKPAYVRILSLVSTKKTRQPSVSERRLFSSLPNILWERGKGITQRSSLFPYNVERG